MMIHATLWCLLLDRIHAESIDLEFVKDMLNQAPRGGGQAIEPAHLCSLQSPSIFIRCAVPSSQPTARVADAAADVSAVICHRPQNNATGWSVSESTITSSPVEPALVAARPSVPSPVPLEASASA
jgi:hypothetical protein